MRYLGEVCRREGKASRLAKSDVFPHWAHERMGTSSKSSTRLRVTGSVGLLRNGTCKNEDLSVSIDRLFSISIRHLCR